MAEYKIIIEYEESSKAYKWAKRFICAAAAVVVLQIGSDITVGLRNRKLFNTPKYDSMDALTAGFEDEKKKLGLEDQTMYLEVVSKPGFIGGSKWEPNDVYRIKIGKEHMTKGVLKHEMFHAKRIKEGKVKPARTRFRPLENYEEWLATSYALKED